MYFSISFLLDLENMDSRLRGNDGLDKAGVGSVDMSSRKEKGVMEITP